MIAHHTKLWLAAILFYGALQAQVSVDLVGPGGSASTVVSGTSITISPTFVVPAGFSVPSQLGLELAASFSAMPAGVPAPVFRPLSFAPNATPTATTLCNSPNPVKCLIHSFSSNPLAVATVPVTPLTAMSYTINVTTTGSTAPVVATFSLIDLQAYDTGTPTNAQPIAAGKPYVLTVLPLGGPPAGCTKPQVDAQATAMVQTLGPVMDSAGLVNLASVEAWIKAAIQGVACPQP